MKEITINDKIKEIMSINEDLIEKCIYLNTIGSFMNFLEDAFEELGDDELKIKYMEIIDLINKKREKIAYTKIKQKSGLEDLE